MISTESWHQLRENPEFQSAIIRFVIWSIFFGYVYSPALGLVYKVLFWLYLVVFVSVFISVFHIPYSRFRRYFTIVVDITGASIAIYGLGDATSPLILVFAWIYVGYGFRYGAHFLLVAAVTTLLGYMTVAYLLESWASDPTGTTLASVVLGLLPLYQYLLQRRLEEAKSAAERADRAKTEFLATMSHSLKTPLTTVVGMGQLLEGTALDGRQREYLGSLRASSGVLQTQIQDVLDIARIGAQELQLNPTVVHPGEMAVDVVRAMIPTAEKRGLGLHAWIGPRLPAVLAGDDMRLRQILHHLLDNAIKFTERGEVRVKVGWSPGTDDEGELMMIVEDTGIGISAEELPHVFERFWQGDVSLKRNRQGIGLGTALVKQLVELMHGQIAVESSAGVGTRFTVRVPFRLTSESVSPIPPGSLAGITLGVLSVCNFEREMITAYCRYLGGDVLRLDPGAKQPGRRIDALLIGYVGPFALEQLVESALSGSRETPVILVNGHGAEDRNYRLLRKPFLAKDLYLLLRDVFDGTSNRAREPETSPAQSALKHGVVDADQYAGSSMVLVVEDDPDISRLISTILEAEGYGVETVEDGFKALERLESGYFDLALVDLRMPKMDGQTLVREWRSREAKGGRKRIPMIAVTAETLDSVRRETLAAGMDDFLSKPIDLESLLVAIRTRLGRDAPDGSDES